MTISRLALALLLGLAAACADEHPPPKFERLDCERCHLSLFVPRDFVHIERQEPDADTRCWTCHGTTSWYPATRGNPERHLRDGEGRRIFSIETEAHRGYDCWQCHVDPEPDNPENAPDPGEGFLCATCHEHSAGRTDPLHGGMDGYEHDSNRCFDCHPRGEED